jgi:FkbM family methyltransferase
VPLRARNAVRMALGRYPKSLRERHPDLALMRLRRGAVVLDVGAHEGDFSECVLAHQPWARLHAFEPLPGAFAELRRRLAPFGGVELWPFALGSREEVRGLTVRRYAQATSFLPNGPVLDEGLFGLDFSTRETLPVRVRRLADHAAERGIVRVDLLKLDVQGFEIEVLEGAGRLLETTGWVYAEAHLKPLYEGGPLLGELARFLEGRGFALVRTTAPRLDRRGEPVECDAIFRRRGRATGG